MISSTGASPRALRTCWRFRAGAKHPREAFEFIAYVQRLDVMERLCSLHCKNTPLSHHSDTWYADHPNPYVDIFDRLASSPNARTLPPIPTWSMVTDELGAVIQRVALLKQDSKPALDEAQQRLHACSMSSVTAIDVTR